MKNLIRFATPLIAVAIMTSAPAVTLAQTSQAAQSMTDDWNKAPAGGPEQEQAWKDGVEAAKLDSAAKRKIDAKSSYLYNHPPVKGKSRDSYRSTFESGYNASVAHNQKS